MHSNVKTVYLDALIQDEMAMSVAKDRLDTAQAEFHIASRRYAATRDWVVSLLPLNPYRKDFEWPIDINTWDLDPGRFRFIHMKLGDAIKEVLGESDKPLSLGEVWLALIRGHLQGATRRSANAALLQLDGIEKTQDDKYRYSSVDDLPF